ncbi:hypothetical protein [Microvirga tunisiensis]|uniref:hypothetical protein n=1 Tax=Microvirga tunisiensis TaxID=2108360 RepID=UPI00129CEC91|nr:hypothetical protein [Microvirga tunisiensis]
MRGPAPHVSITALMGSLGLSAWRERTRASERSWIPVPGFDRRLLAGNNLAH